MTGQPDGSIIIDTELDPQGFDAGSKELESAISSFEKTISKIGQSLNSLGPTFTRALQGSESAITSFDSKIGQIDESLEKAREEIAAMESQLNELAGAQVPTEQYQQLSDKVDSTCTKLDALVEKQKQLVQSDSNGYITKYQELQDQISATESKLEQLRALQAEMQQSPGDYGAADFSRVKDEITSLEVDLEGLNMEMRELESSSGASAKIAQYNSLQTQIEQLSAVTDEAVEKMAEMEQNGTAFQMGSDTSKYAELQAELARLKEEYDKAASSADRMRSGVSSAGSQSSSAASKTSKFTAAAKILKTTLTKTGQVAKTAFSKVASCISSAASSVKKLISHTKSSNNQFEGLISSAKKFTLSLLGARGVYALLRKAVSAYMDENEELSNTLDSCWTGIGNLLGPIITKLINLVAKATSYVTSFLKLFNIFGTNASKSIDKANESAKDLKRTTASFDQLNILKEKDSSSDNKSDDTKTELPEVTLPDWVSDIAEKIKSGDWAGVGKLLAEQLNKALSSIDWTKIKNTVKGWATKIADFLNSFISNTDWGLVGRTIANGIGTAILFALTLIKNFNFKNAGNAIGDLINGLLSVENASNLAEAASTLLKGIFDALTAAVKRINWKQVGKTIIAFITNFKLSDVVESATNLINSLAEAITKTDFKAIGNALREQIKNVNWKGLWDGAVNLFTSAFQGLGDFLGFDFDTSNLKKALQDISEPFSKLFGTIKDSFGKLLTPIVEKLLPSAVNFIGKLAEALSPIIDALTPFLSTVIDVVSRIIDALAPVLPTLGKLLANIVSKIVPILEPFLNLIATVVEALAPALDAIFSVLDEIITALEPFIDILMTVLEPILDAIGGIVTALAGVIEFISGVFTGDWEKAWGGIKKIFEGIWTAMKGIVESIWNAIKGIFKGAWEFIKGVWNGAGKFFSGIWEGIKKVFSKVGEWFGNVFSKAWEGVKKVWSSVTGFFSKIWNGIKNIFSVVADWFKNIFSKAWGAVKKVFEAGGRVFEGIKDGIVTAFKAVVNAIIRGINKVIAIPFNAINGILDGIRGIQIFDWKPFDWIGRLPVPQIPELAQGGVLKKGQIGFLEGDGAEAVVPLERNTGWISKVAEQLAKYLSGNNAPGTDWQVLAATILDGLNQIAQTMLAGISRIASQSIEGIRKIVVDANGTAYDFAPLYDIADAMANSTKMLTSLGELRLPQIATGTIMPITNRAEAVKATMGSTGTPMGAMDDVDEHLYDIESRLNELIALVKALNLNIDINALTEMITKQQRTNARNYGGAI
jgi:phage-related protein